MSGQIIGPIGVLPTTTAGVLTIDGTPVHVNASTATVTTGTLTATQANDYIIVGIVSNATVDIVSVKSGAGTSFTQIATQGGSGNYTEIFALFSSGVFNDTVVVVQGAAGFCTVDAFAVSGSGQTSLIFDAGGPQAASPDPVSITTASPNTMVIAFFREGAAANPTAGAGFSQISGADFALTEYKLVPTATTTSCTQTVGVGTAVVGIAIAIVHA